MRMDAEQRRQMVLSAALRVAANQGLAAVTYENVAAACPVDTSAATVRRYAGRIPDMQRNAVLRAGGSLRVRLAQQLVTLGIELIPSKVDAA